MFIFVVLTELQSVTKELVSQDSETRSWSESKYLTRRRRRWKKRRRRRRRRWRFPYFHESVLRRSIIVRSEGNGVRKRRRNDRRTADGPKRT